MTSPMESSLPVTPRILVLTGSLRAASVTTAIADVAIESPSDRVSTLRSPSLGDLPFYNEDLDTADPPAPVSQLRRSAGEADGLLLVSPVNNGSVSAVLKNAVDWLSRPRGRAALLGKPVAIILAGWSLGSAETHLEEVLHVAGATVVPTTHRALSLKTFRGLPPRDAPPVRDAVERALTALAAASTSEAPTAAA